MNRKMICITISVVLVVTMIALGGVFVNNKVKMSTRQLTEELLKKKEKLNNDYKSFTNSVNEYNIKRNELNSLSNLYYYQKLNSNYSKLNSFFVEYEKVIGDLDSNTKSLRKDCQNIDVKYSDNSKCSSYLSVYEQAMNIYFDDLTMYNKLIKEYNSWTTGNKINEFKSSYISDYIDADDDNVYAGKKE